MKTKNIDKFVNDWYTQEYPDDLLGKKINPFLTKYSEKSLRAHVINEN